MKPKIQFPNNNTANALTKAIERARKVGRTARHKRGIEWKVVRHWLEGGRVFDITKESFKTGNLVLGWRSPVGDYHVRIEEALVKSQAEKGRLGLLRLGPSALPLPIGLEAQRKAAMAQVAFDYALSKEELDATLAQIEQYTVDYGNFGVLPSFDAWPDGTPIYGLEVVPPWEIIPVPSEPHSPEDAGAIMRERWVPIEYLLTLRRADGTAPLSKIPRQSTTLQVMGARSVPYGDDLKDDDSPESDHHAFTTDDRNERLGSRAEANAKTSSVFVRLVETWVRGPADTLARYIAVVGDKVLIDETFGDQKWQDANPNVPRPPPFPLGIGGYYPVGGFWFRGFTAPLVSVNHELEKTLGSLFKQIRDFETMGMLFVPQNMGINKRRLKVSGHPQFMEYEPDHVTPDLRPFNIAPVSASPAAATVAQMSLGLIDRVATQGEMFSGGAPGRVDSQVGLNFLFQTTNVPLDVVANNMKRALVCAYRAILYQARISISEFDKIRLTRIDDAVAGLVIDPRSGAIGKSNSGIPWPHEVEVTVQSTKAESPDQKKQEIQAHWQAQLIDDLDYWIALYQEGIETPSMKKELEAAVEKATMNNIFLFGDGETVTPANEVFFEPDADNVEVFLRVLQQFIAKPIFGLASPDIQDLFWGYKDRLLQRDPSILPEGAPTPEQAVEEPAPGIGSGAEVEPF